MKVTCHPCFCEASRVLQSGGVDAAFFRSRGAGYAVETMRAHAVLSAALTTGGTLSAVLLLHTASNEISLWVRPELRGLGVGSACLTAALGQVPVFGRRTPIYARSSVATTPLSEAMRSVLRRAGFRRAAVGMTLDLWILHRDSGSARSLSDATQDNRSARSG